MGYYLPHNPLICSRDLFEHYMAALSVPQPMPEQYMHHLHPALRLWRQRRGIEDLAPEQNHRALAAYYGLVTEMDRNIGRVIEAVQTSASAEIARSLLARIQSRWSVDRMIDGYDKELRDRQLIGACGHDPIPCDISESVDLLGANEFDFEQVPNWPEIRKRLEE